MVNKVILLGRLGKDPEVKSFDGGNKIANFSIATTEKHKDKDGNMVENTDWHNIIIKFTKQAEVAEKYLKKGMLIYIEGKLKNRSLDNKDGVKQHVTEISCDNFQMLGTKQEDDKNGDAPATKKEHKEDIERDLPF